MFPEERKPMRPTEVLAQLEREASPSRISPTLRRGAKYTKYRPRSAQQHPGMVWMPKKTTNQERSREVASYEPITPRSGGEGSPSPFRPQSQRRLEQRDCAFRFGARGGTPPGMMWVPKGSTHHSPCADEARFLRDVSR